MREIDALVSSTDLFATVAGVLGEPLPPGAAEDSVDQSSVLLGETEEARGAPGPRTSVVHHSFDGMFALRSGSWKLIEGLGSGGFTDPARIEPEPGGPTRQLYDLAADPVEAHDLVLELPDVVERLQDELNALRAKS